MREIFLERVGTNHEEFADPAGGIPVTRFPFVIGRGSHCDSVIRHELVSRNHCSLFLKGEDIWVRDLGSRNGTTLNGKPLTEPQPVQEGDILKIAHLFFNMDRMVGQDFEDGLTNLQAVAQKPAA